MASRLLEIQVQQQKCTACGTNMAPEISWRCHGCPYSERARKKAKGMIDNKGKGKTKRERVGGGHECRECEMGTLRYPHPLTGSSGVTGEERVGGGEWCGEGQRHLHEFRYPHPLTGSPGGGRIRSDEDDRSNSSDSSGEAVSRAMARRAIGKGKGKGKGNGEEGNGEEGNCSVSPFKGT